MRIIFLYHVAAVAAAVWTVLTHKMRKLDGFRFLLIHGHKGEKNGNKPNIEGKKNANGTDIHEQIGILKCGESIAYS